MSQNTAIIKIWDQQVGAVAWSESEQLAAFEFDPKFLNSDLDLAPIMMPLANAKNKIYSFPATKLPNTTFRGLPGLLADMLPDKYGNALINAWLAAQGRSSNSLTSIETLCFIGKRGIGALEIEPMYRDDSKKSSILELAELVGIAGKILDHRQKFQSKLNASDEAALYDILKIGTSAGGARAKAIIAYNEKTKEVRSGQVQAPKGFGYWIIKFDGVNDQQFASSTGYGRVEMAYHLMAKEAGINMAACQMLEENGRAHFMTQRFDRKADGSKIHMQSFCALRHFDFNMVGYFAYEQLFETMRMLGLAYTDAEQLFRRMVFNVLARNCDDHTKNFAFLMEADGLWKLSPAFDICHAYRPKSTWVSSQSLTVNGKREGFSDNDFLAVANAMNIKKARYLIDEVRTAIKKWPTFAAMTGVDQKLQKAIQATLLV